MKHRRTVRWGERCRLLIGQVAPNARSGDLRDLVSVYKAMAMLRTNNNPIELIKLGYLQNVHHFPELRAG